jgi:arsenate reductase-like glutaredoxin family protein
VLEKVDAKKVRFDGLEAVALVRKAKLLVSVRGGKVVRLSMAAARTDNETLAKQIMGPTGNLRAPALRTGEIFIVGYNQDEWDTVLRN